MSFSWNQDTMLRMSVSPELVSLPELDKDCDMIEWGPLLYRTKAERPERATCTRFYRNSVITVLGLNYQY